MVFVDPEAGVRSSSIIALSYRCHLPLRAKETCFGLMMEGERETVRGFMALLKDAYPVRPVPEAPAVLHRRHQGLCEDIPDHRAAACSGAFPKQQPLLGDIFIFSPCLLLGSVIA